MADENWGNGNGRTPSPRREDAPAEFREPPREERREQRDDRREQRDDRDSRDRQDYRPPARSGGGGGGDSSVNPGNNLHVRGLAMETTEEVLQDIFGKFGPIEKCQVMKDPRTRESRGFAFVTFEEVSDAQSAMSALSGTTLDNRTISVELAKRGRARTPTPGQYQGPDKSRSVGYGGGDRRGGYEPRRDRDYPPRRYDDDRRAQPMRDYRGRDDDRPPRRDYDDRPPRRDYDDRRPPRRDYDRRDEEPRRERRDERDDSARRF